MVNGERRLSLEEVLQGLLADGHIHDSELQRLRELGMGGLGKRHPLSLIGGQELRSKKPPHSILTAEYLTEWLAPRVGLPYRRVDPLKIDYGVVTRLVSNAYAKRLNILPLEVAGQDVVVGCAEPWQAHWADELGATLGMRIHRVLINPDEIGRYLAEFHALARSVDQATSAFGAEVSRSITNFEQLVRLGESGPVDANDSHVVHIVDWLLQYAFDQGASDIHVEPRRDLGFIRFRIDGVLHQVYQIHASVLTAMVSRLKILGRMDVVERRRPQDGRIKTLGRDGNEIELRLSTMPTAFGEKLVLRIFSPDVVARDLGALGFEEAEQDTWRQMIARPNGIILVTGPTGSGKTTTLYSTLRILARPEVNVCTVEDPIEMVEPAFNQMQVQPAIGVDFAAGVRTLLRQDPDIIMVGEIRDLETATMAVQAALTGHLVLSTLHTNDAPAAITRLLELGVPPYLINATLIGVMAQRLVRQLCTHCRRAGPPDPQSWDGLLAGWGQEMPRPRRIHHAMGCLECRNTGYQGRLGIYEMLVLDEALRGLVQPGCDVARLRRQAWRAGMRPLRVGGVRKIAQGLTTPEEVLRVTPPLNN